MNYSKYIFYTVFIGALFTVAFLYVRLVDIEQVVAVQRQQVSQLTIDVERLKKKDLLEQEVIQGKDLTQTSSDHVPSSEDLDMIISRRLAVFLCDLAINVGQLELAKSCIETYQINEFKALLTEKLQQRQSVQSKILKLIHEHAPQQESTEKGLIDKLIKFESVKKQIDFQPIKQTLLHAHWLAEQGFNGWDQVAYQLNEYSDSVRDEDKLLSDQLSEIASSSFSHLETGDKNV